MVLEKENTGLSEILYALRNAPKSNNQSPAELQLGRKLTTIKDIITTKPTTNRNTVSDNDSNLELEMSVFPRDQYSEIMVRERARGSKLEDTYKRKKGRGISETQHTLTMKETGNTTQSKTFSKREITKAQPPLAKQSSQSENASTSKQRKEDEQTEETQQTKTNEQQNSKKERRRDSKGIETTPKLEGTIEIRRRRRKRKTQTRKKTIKHAKTTQNTHASRSQMGRKKYSQG